MKKNRFSFRRKKPAKYEEDSGSHGNGKSLCNNYLPTLKLKYVR